MEGPSAQLPFPTGAFLILQIFGRNVKGYMQPLYIPAENLLQSASPRGSAVRLCNLLDQPALMPPLPGTLNVERRDKVHKRSLQRDVAPIGKIAENADRLS